MDKNNNNINTNYQLLPIHGQGTIIFNANQQDNCSFHFINNLKKV